MINLKNLLKKPLQLHRIPKWILVLLVVLALVGFADASYLTVEHYQNIIPPCSVGGCETVLTSSYSEVYGVPVSLLGAIYYFIVLLSMFIYFDVKNEVVKDICLKIVVALSTVGVVISLAFIALMLFVIHSICIYCMVSDSISTVIFIIACHIMYLGYFKKTEILI